MTTMFDEDIATYEKELNQIFEKMERARQGFVSSGVAYMQKLYNTKARYFVQERFEWTNELGRDKLSNMKQKVNALIQNASTEVATILSDDQHWWHRSRGGGWKDHRSKDMPEGLELALYTATVRLVPILKDHGYLSDEDVPEFVPSSSSSNPPTERKKSPFDVEWTEDMVKYVDAYKEHMGRAMFLDAKLRESRKLKAKYQAAALWDEA